MSWQDDRSCAEVLHTKPECGLEKSAFERRVGGSRAIRDQLERGALSEVSRSAFGRPFGPGRASVAAGRGVAAGFRERLRRRRDWVARK